MTRRQRFSSCSMRPAPAELLGHRGEELWGGREIVEVVAARPVVPVDLGQQVAEAFVGAGLGKVGPQVVESFGELLPQPGVERVSREDLDVVGQLLTKLVVAHFAPRQTDDRQLVSQQSFSREVVKGRNQLALGQIA